MVQNVELRGLMGQIVVKTLEIPVHKQQVDNMYPQNIVDCHQFVLALPTVHE